MNVKSALSCAVALLAGAAVLTACGPDTSQPAKASASTHPAFVSPAPARSTQPTSPPSRSLAPSGPAATAAPTRGTGGTGAGNSGSGSGSPGGGDATSDSYAYRHPCTSAQLSVHLVPRAAASTQRIIEVRNLGTRSCGLSYYPQVVLYNGDSATGDPSVKPEVPEGLGGAPASPVYAGRTAYAVIDLDPSGDTHPAAMINTMNVLPDGWHMSSRYTRRFRLGTGDRVVDPKLGLYERTVADAVDSLHSVGPTP